MRHWIIAESKKYVTRQNTHLSHLWSYTWASYGLVLLCARHIFIIAGMYSPFLFVHEKFSKRTFWWRGRGWAKLAILNLQYKKPLRLKSRVILLMENLVTSEDTLNPSLGNNWTSFRFGMTNFNPNPPPMTSKLFMENFDFRFEMTNFNPIPQNGKWTSHGELWRGHLESSPKGDSFLAKLLCNQLYSCNGNGLWSVMSFIM